MWTTIEPVGISALLSIFTGVWAAWKSISTAYNRGFEDGLQRGSFAIIDHVKTRMPEEQFVGLFKGEVEL